MSFTSPLFLGAFPFFYLLYLALSKHVRLQNVLLLLASYGFYALWDWRFLGVLVASTLWNFAVGVWLDRPAGDHSARRTRLVWCSVAFNLAVLGFFKYVGFFRAGLVSMLSSLGLGAHPAVLDIGLPLGISFYTLQNLGYTIDVYKRRLKPTRDLLDFGVYAAFFPQLLAGPIQRAAVFLPQIQQPRKVTLEKVNTGLFLILWGLAKKIVIADNLSQVVDAVFGNYTAYAGLDILLALLAFSVQIYCDFSGYSDIARGLGRMLGFDLLVNFRLPYFSASPSDFWQRWHVSLSSWLRDYIFFPLRQAFLRGGHRGQVLLASVVPVMATMLASGLWHGVGPTYVVWGAYHGLALALQQVWRERFPHRPPRAGARDRLTLVAQIMLMNIVTTFGWLIFRAPSLSQAGAMLGHISLSASPQTSAIFQQWVFFSLPLVAVELHQYVRHDLLSFARIPLAARIVLVSGLAVLIIVFGARASTEFFYFQF